MMKTIDWYRSAAVAAGLGVLAASSSAVAQDGGFQLDVFSAAETADDGFAISRPNDRGHMRFGAQLTLDYARNPLVFETTQGDADTEEDDAIVSDQLVANIGLSLGLANRLVIFVGLPVNLLLDGEDRIGFPSVDGTSIGDPRLGARVRLLGEREQSFALALQLSGTLPLGRLAVDDSAYAGDRTATLTPEVLMEIRAGQRLRIDLNLGVRIRGDNSLPADGSLTGFTTGTQAVFGLGLGIIAVPDLLDFAIELYGQSDFDNYFERENTPIEAIAGVRLHPIRGLTIGLAAGPGLTRGVGSPDVRGVFTVGYAAPVEEPVVAPPPPGDRDGDGLTDDVDQCPDDPEDRDNFEDENGCPDPDNDQDGVLDEPDQCDDQPEDRDEFEDENGCPDPDNDADGIPDTSDQCRNEPEDRDNFEDENGCPDPDNDQDGVLDATDQCPLVPETRNGIDDEDGCPDNVRIEGGQIVILQRVEFETDSDVILPISFPILTEVAATIRGNPQIRQIRVEGHTDDRGPDAHNMDLSQRRAQSVRRWLVENNVEDSRLVAEGFGETRPRVPNRGRANRQTNRRVEFHIVGGAEGVVTQ